MVSAPKPLSWRDVKQQVNKLEPSTLVTWLGDLYALNADNRAFMHARLGLGDDPLAAYKAVIDRWVCPNVQRNQDISVNKASRALHQCAKAMGDALSMAELAMYYCEACADFLSFCGVEDEGYFIGIVNAAEQALDAIVQLDEDSQQAFLLRLDVVWAQSTEWGWGVNEDISTLMLERGFDLD